jgi:hypothetical protein
MADTLIPMPLWDERQDWELYERSFLSCDLCGETELGPWMAQPASVGAWGQMHWDYDGITVCQKCADTGEHLKVGAAGK